MLIRIVVGILAAAVLVSSILVGNLFLIVLGVATVFAMYEIYSAMGRSGMKPLKWTGYLFAVVFVPLGYFIDYQMAFMLLALLGFFSLAHRIFHPNCTLYDMFSSVFCLFYIGMPLSFLLTIYSFEAADMRLLCLAMTFGCSIVTDVFAYFTGITLGRHKLAPVISPKKTYEGSFGGIVGSVLFALIMNIVQGELFGTAVPVEHFLAMGVLFSAMAQLGDLVASSIKRLAGIKDFGNIFPGHGGMLDRADSILFNAPIAYAYFYLLLLG